MTRSVFSALVFLSVCACSGEKDGANATATGGTGGGSTAGGGASSTGGSRGGAGGSGAGGSSAAKACTELAACCEELPSDLAPSCTLVLESGSESTCSTAIVAFQVQGHCSDEPVEDPTGGLPPVTLDGAWQPATSPGSGARAYEYFEIQACGDGDVLGVWRTEGDLPSVLAARFDGKADTWSTFPALDADNGLYATRPKLAANASCEAVALWMDGLDVINGDDEYTLTASRFADGAWGAPVVLRDRYQSELRKLTVLLDDTGSAELGYEVNTEAPGPAFRQTLNEAGAGELTAMSTLSVTGAAFGMLASGDAVFLVAENDDAQPPPVDNFLRTWTRTPNGVWSAPSTQQTTPDVHQYNMEVVPARDRFYIYWETSGGVPHLSVQLPGQQPASIEVPATLSLRDAFFIASGDTLFAYAKGDHDVHAVRFTTAGGWEEPLILSAEMHTLHDDLGMVVDSAGRATFVYTAPEEGVFANRFTPEAGWSGPHAVDIHGSESRIAADEAGRVFISYLTFRSTGFLQGTNDLQLRRFLPDALL